MSGVVPLLFLGFMFAPAFSKSSTISSLSVHQKEKFELLSVLCRNDTPS